MKWWLRVGVRRFAVALWLALVIWTGAKAFGVVGWADTPGGQTNQPSAPTVATVTTVVESTTAPQDSPAGVGQTVEVVVPCEVPAKQNCTP